MAALTFDTDTYDTFELIRDIVKVDPRAKFYDCM